MKVYLFIFCCIITISCKTAQYSKIVRKNLSDGKESCKTEILRILENDKLYSDHISYLRSFPKDAIFYDKKSKEIPFLYQHEFKLEKDSLINYVFTLTSDANGQFLIEHNSKYRDYMGLKEYVRLLKNKEELKKLIDLGIEYFGDNRFNISFSYSSFDIDYTIEKEMTQKEKNRVKEIRKKRRMYELVDKDRTHNEFMQEFKQKAIIVVPEIIKIINEVTLSYRYTF